MQNISANKFFCCCCCFVWLVVFFFFAFLSCNHDLLINLILQIFFLLLSYKQELQAVKYYLSRISTSSIIKLKKLQNLVFQPFLLIYLNLALKIYCFLKVFLLRAQCLKHFLYYIEFLCRTSCEKNSSLNFMSLIGFQASKIQMFLQKSYCDASFKIIFFAEIIP